MRKFTTAGPLCVNALVVVFLFMIASCEHDKPASITNYVNPLVGTAVSTTESARRHSEAGSELRGQTFPAVGVPNGMTYWTPQTRASERKCISPYYYEDDSIQGFRGSHWLSGSCTQDYGSVTLMPVAGSLRTGVKDRASSYVHQDEVSRPDFYSVHLQRYNIKAEITGTSRAGFMRFENSSGLPMHVTVEPNSDEGEAFIRISPERGEIEGYNPVHRIYQGWGEPAGFSGYFLIVFDTPFESFGTFRGDSLSKGNAKSEGRGNATGAYVSFPSEVKTVQVRIGTSFTGFDGARKNLAAEIGSATFGEVAAATRSAWEEVLSGLTVEGPSEEDKQLFYTALYHSRLHPRVMSDVDGLYPGFGGDTLLHRMESGEYYDDFSLWDTFRAVHPLLTLTAPATTRDMVRSQIGKYRQGGWLPIFPCWNNYTAAMIGDHGSSMLGDALVKGIGEEYLGEAYEAMRKNAFEVNADPVSYNDGKGRRALESYLRYGYIPLEDSVWESFHKREQVSRTLEYAYNDFVIGMVARKAGKLDDYEKLMSRSRNYRNVIDSVSGYARGKFADGKWIEPFDPFAPRATFITEGSPFQYTMFVPHDPDGLIAQLGGYRRFEEKLDNLFDDGHYWHGNEPGHHSVYLYAFAGVPWKIQQRVGDIIRQEYSNGPGGLSGNEDSGQMSAWLVFSMAGFYPVCPGLPYYVITTPSFEKVTIAVGVDKSFVIRCTGFGNGNKYIRSVSLNGEALTRSYLLHDEIMAGGELLLTLGDQPQKDWATTPRDMPPSLGRMPVF